MKVVRGVVRRVSRSAEVSGDRNGFSTSHVLTCQVGRRAVEINMGRMPNIHEGDEIVVAGRLKQGTLVARAYHNLSNGSSGRWDYHLIVGIMGGGLFFVLAATFLPPLALLVLLLGAWRLVQILRVFRAYRAVMAED